MSDRAVRPLAVATLVVAAMVASAVAVVQPGGSSHRAPSRRPHRILNATAGATATVTAGQLTTAAHLRAMVAINDEKRAAAEPRQKSAVPAQRPHSARSAPAQAEGGSPRRGANPHDAHHGRLHRHPTRERVAIDRRRRISHHQPVEHIQPAHDLGRSRRTDGRHRFDQRRLYPPVLMGPDAPPPKGRSVVHRVIAHLRSNLVGWVALFVALGGTGYAAISIPRNSVGAAQIRNRSITPVKFNPSSIGGSVRAWAIIRSNATVLASSGKRPVVFASAFPGSYVIHWGVLLPRTCATVANVDERSPDQTPIQLPNGGGASAVIGYASNVDTETVPSGGGHKVSETVLDTFNQAGQPTPMTFDVAVMC